MDPATGFVRAPDGVRIAYATHGAGPPLVFVRGWITHLELMWSVESFRSFFESLGRVMQVVRYDTRGNGLSDRDVPAPELDALVVDLEAVVDGLGLERATLWGSSFGGPIAATYAHRHPERVERLILEGTYDDGRAMAGPEQRRSTATMVALLESDPEPAYAALSYVTDPRPRAPHEERVQRMLGSIDATMATHLYALAPRVDVTDTLATLTVPTLVLHRRGSRPITYETGRRVAALVPGARFVSLDGAAHNPWEENPDQALEAIVGFAGLAERWREPAPETAGATTGPESAASQPEHAGFVTVMFTDLVGSAALTSALGDSGAQELLRHHNRVVRDALAETGGVEVKHTGDGIMARFGSASRAIDCAIAIQRALSEAEPAEAQAADPEAIEPDRSAVALALRIGINAGEPIAEEGDVFGTAVQVAARLCDAAGPGQVVVSNVVRELVAGRPYRFEDLGARRLKGVAEAVRAYAVTW